MRFAAAIALVVVLTVAAVWLVAYGPGNDVDDVEGYKPVESPRGEPVTVVVEPGAATEAIANNLQSTGAIGSATQFRVLVALLGYDHLLQSGEYEFDRGTSELDAVYRMRRGLVSTKSVTVVEGWRLEEIADAVAEQGIQRNDFIAAARRGDYEFPFLEDLGIGQKLEGYLFPATYTIRRRDTAQDVVRQMLQAFADNVPATVQEQGDALDLTLHEVVTLASIIEREAVVAEERPIMAQVFLRRLDLGMPLEADPTVQYALGNDPENVAEFGYWKQGLTEDDLAIQSPYNTYVESGLPPGPISNPRLDSINAVLNPADTNYLYFVAKEDGSHAFAETFQEHLENIELFGGESAQ
jgi:peptidoglycan lytic transglycosylase G